MTANLLKTLYLDKTLSDDELKDIPFYRQELHFHVMYKGAEVRRVPVYLSKTQLSDRFFAVGRNTGDVCSRASGRTDPRAVIVSHSPGCQKG